MTSPEKPRKSVVLSGALSFFFGPLGWLYSAPWPVAVGGGLAYLVACKLLPTFLLVYLLGIAAPISAVVGVLYAMGFNMAGARTPLFGKERPPPRLGP
jgi:hypothetical protein